MGNPTIQAEQTHPQPTIHQPSYGTSTASPNAEDLHASSCATCLCPQSKGEREKACLAGGVIGGSLLCGFGVGGLVAFECGVATAKWVIGASITALFGGAGVCAAPHLHQ